MYSTGTILDKMHADQYLAIRLERALKGVKDEMLEQGRNIQAGATRAIYYTSCFTQNYQDVCENQKSEDTRFLRAIVRLVKERDAIGRMVRIYVDLLLQNLTPDRIRRIQKKLTRIGANLASGSLTNQTLAGLITTAVCYSVGLGAAIERTLLRYGTRSVAITGLYGYVQAAADAANRLKQLDGLYYSALYAEDLEMLYFLIDSVISRNPALSRIRSSDNEIANAILRIIR